jgi:predicted RNA-binding protein with PUA-like domain
MKSEASVFSIDDLKEKKQEHWDGVRNYQARNFMKNDMKVGDMVLFYHSNAKPSGVAGIAKVCKEAYPDFTSWDTKSKYYDEKSTKEDPRWFMVDLCFVRKFKRVIPLQELKENKKLKDMMVVQKGSRLSVQPVTKQQFDLVLKIL